MKEYRDEAMKHLEAGEKAESAETDQLAWATFSVNASIAASLIDIAETLHAVRAALDRSAHVA